MDIRLFDEFLELAKRLNFTEAAKALNLTQSALSKHVSVLEREFGAELFKRTRQKVELTEAGRVLYERALAITDNYHRAYDEVAKIKARPPIRIAGIIHNQEIVSLISYALELSDQFSAQQGLITPVVVDQFMPLLTNGEVDLCIISQSPGIPESTQLEFRHLYNDRFIAVVSKDHRLAESSEISLENCTDETFLQLISDYSAPAWECIEYACSQAGFEPKKKSHLIKSAMEYATIPLGNTIYIVPETTLVTSPIRYNQNLTHVPVTDDYAVFPLGAMYLKEQEEHLEEFLEVLQEAASIIVERMKLSRKRSAPFKTRVKNLADEHGLSEDESAVLMLYAKGNQEERIAEELGLSIQEVKTAVGSIFKKIDVAKRQDLLDLIDR